jgi:hypothetical protein
VGEELRGSEREGDTMRERGRGERDKGREGERKQEKNRGLE